MFGFTTLALAVMASAPAAPPYQVERPDGTKLTYASLSDHYAKQGRTLKSFSVRVASEGFRPLTQLGKIHQSGAPPFAFLEEVRLIGASKEDYYQTDRDSERYFLLGSVGEPGQEPVLLGWVPVSLVLTRNECMRDPTSGIRIKGIPINSVGHLKKAGLAADDDRLRPPQVRLAPSPDGKSDGVFRFFDFYHVLADTHPGPDTDTVGYALLGDLAEWNPNLTLTPNEFRANARIIGWVEKSRLCLWRTREALQWDDLKWPDASGQPRKRTEPGVAYPTLEDALQAIRPLTDPPKVNGPVATEVFADGKPVLWDAKRMRFPLLTTRANGEEASYQIFGKRTLYKIGVIGDIYDVQGKPLMQEKDRQAINLDIRQIEQQLNRTEILFVIDRTNSMREWWPNISRVVGRLREKVTAEGRTLAIGFCYYGDVHPGTVREGQAKNLAEVVKLGGARPGRLVELSTEGALFDQQLQELADKSRVIDGGGRLEMVYAGVEIGLREAKWGGTQGGKFARKMVILIGDDGNHKLEPKEEEEVHDRIANLCVFGRSEPPPPALAKQLFESPKEFYVLQMNPVSTDPADPSYLFRSQTKALIERIKGKSPLARAEYFHVSDEKALYTTIDSRYAELVSQVGMMKQELLRLRTGVITTAIQDPEVAALVRAVAAKHNLKIEDLTGGTQAFDIRYVWSHGSKTGEPLVRKMILTTDGEIAQLLSRLKSLFHDPQNLPSLEAIAVDLIVMQSGDGLTPDQVRKLDARDKEARLEVLKREKDFSFIGPLQSLIRPQRPENLELTSRILQRLEKRLYLLEDIRAERVSMYKKRNASDMVGLERVGVPVALVGDQRRGFSRGEEGPGSPRRTVWYWLDLEEEWP